MMQGEVVKRNWFHFPFLLAPFTQAPVQFNHNGKVKFVCAHLTSNALNDALLETFLHA